MNNRNRTTNNIKKEELKSIRQPNKKKARMQKKIENAVDNMMKQAQMWEMATKSYQDLNPYYIVDENGKRLNGAQMRKLRKQGLLPPLKK